MALGDFEKMEGLYTQELLQLNLQRISLKELDIDFDPGETMMNHNRGILRSSGVTGMFEMIKLRSVFLLSCYSVVIEESPTCKFLSLKWGYKQIPGGEGSRHKTIFAQIKDEEVYIGYLTPKERKVSKVRNNNLPKLVGRALVRAAEM